MSEAIEILGTQDFDVVVEECLVKGVVRGPEGEELAVSLPDGQEGRVRLAEYGGAVPPAGTAVRLFVDAHDASGTWRLSKEKADRLDIWARIEEANEKGTIIEGEIIAPAEGGWSVDIGTKAFLPGSQLDLMPVRDAARYMGKKLPFKIIRFNRGRGNIVVSRRVILEEERSSTVAKLTMGAVLEGKVQSFADYGAFIDVGGVVGLLHVTDMSWGPVSHPSEIIELNQRVKVKVLKWDADKNRLSLGIRQLQEDPWIDAEKKYRAGTAVRGKVVSITDYGMFLVLEPGVEGLLHTKGSVLGTDRARELSRKISIGDEIEAVVVELDPLKKRLSLGLKVE